MACAICNRDDDQNLIRAIWDGEIKDVCNACIIKENIPVIRKATQEQIDQANIHYSVRERMERLSNGGKHTMPLEQSIAHKNLARLHFPQTRQNHESLVENYDWVLKTGRRRKKLSISQLAEKSGLVAEDIQKLENGQLVEQLEPIISRLENSLGIVLLKKSSKMAQARSVQDENEIIKEVLEKVNHSEEEIPKKEKGNLFKRIASGKLDFSKKENIENITLKDLAEMKRQREQGEMFGDDLEIEEE